MSNVSAYLIGVMVNESLAHQVWKCMDHKFGIMNIAKRVMSKSTPPLQNIYTKLLPLLDNTKNHNFEVK